MADKKNTETTNAEATEVVAKTKEVKPRFEYVGPAYNRGLIIPTGKLIVPHQLNDEQIEKLISTWKYFDLGKYWRDTQAK